MSISDVAPSHLRTDISSRPASSQQPCTSQLALCQLSTPPPPPPPPWHHSHCQKHHKSAVWASLDSVDALDEFFPVRNVLELVDAGNVGLVIIRHIVIRDRRGVRAGVGVGRTRWPSLLGLGRRVGSGRAATLAHVACRVLGLLLPVCLDEVLGVLAAYREDNKAGPGTVTKGRWWRKIMSHGAQ